MAEIWGNITGTLSDQLDLQNELDTKSNGLESVIEEIGKTGWILKDNNGRRITNPVGEYSIDFTWQDLTNTLRVNGATGQYSFAAGRSTLSSGFNSTSFGEGNISSGKSSSTSGFNNTAEGDYSFSTGIRNISSGLNSFSIGDTNTAQGTNTFCGGINSFVGEEGINVFQSGLNSFVFGDNIILNNPNSAAFGTYNLVEGSDNSDLYKVFTVGIGSEILGRQNALEVFNGSGIERGSIKAPYLQQATIDADITGKVLITKEYLESQYNYAFDDAPIDGKIYGRINKGWSEVAAGGNNALQVYFNGIIPPPINLEIPNQPGEFFKVGDVYLHYEISIVSTDGNVADVDGDIGLFDGNLENISYKQYLLRDGSKLDPIVIDYWEEMFYGINEGPQDGLSYSRNDGDWVPTAIQSDVPTDGKQYVRKDKIWEEVIISGGDHPVFKGFEDPNFIVPAFGLEGDNYMKTGVPGQGGNFVIQTLYINSYPEEYVYSSTEGSVISGTSDFESFSIEYRSEGWDNNITFRYLDGLEYPNTIINMNNLEINTDDMIFSNGEYYLESSSLITWWDSIVSTSGVATFITPFDTSIPYSEYTKLADGTWELINWGSLNDAPSDGEQYIRLNNQWQVLDVFKDGAVKDLELVSDGDYVRSRTNGTNTWKLLPPTNNSPLDKKLENADITNITYDINNNLSTIVYGAFDTLVAGYNGVYNYDINNNLTTVLINDNLDILQLTITYTYDVNGNLISVIRT